MGFSTLDGNMLVEMQKKHLNEIKAISGINDNTMNTREKIEELIIDDPGISLKDKEICFFSAQAYVGKQHTRITSVKSAGLHTNLHIMKGVNLRVGNTKLSPERETYWEKIPCGFSLQATVILPLHRKTVSK